MKNRIKYSHSSLRKLFFLSLLCLIHNCILVVLAAENQQSHPDSLFDDDPEWWEQMIREMRGGSSSSSSSRAGRASSSKRASASSDHHHNNNNKEPPDSSTPRRPVLVSIPNQGKVIGTREEGIDFFGGLPYASPPVGNLRLAPPEPPTPWAPQKLDASHFGPDCWQLADPDLNPYVTEENMSEDCLYLNIFTPAGQSHSKKKLPVMIWLHGGAFQQGGARRPEYDGRRLAERDIVVVTLNYRLGALGFMVSSSDGVFGNFGLMDQRAALDWIASHIAAFGGDPDNITLFGESAGAVMIGLHLMMEGAGTNLFHRVIMQSNPLGYTFRSVVIADFIGDALKRSVDCRDLACLRTERVEEIMRAQSSLMGVPRSVGDFFTFGPTLTQEVKVMFGGSSGSSTAKSSSDTNNLPFGMISRSQEHRLFRNLDARWQPDSDAARWSAVNVSQPLKGLHMLPDKIPILIGSNKHEGEMFVHSAFPAPMPKAVYWMFVGALFRDSASRVLKHYRGYVDQVEREAEELARKQMEEHENKMYYTEHREQLENEYELLLTMNATRKANVKENQTKGVQALINAWATGGAQDDYDFSAQDLNNTRSWTQRLWPFGKSVDEAGLTREERLELRIQQREERRLKRKRAKALKEAAKVVVDYRPVMSRIIDDYLFRCPTWHYAHLVSQNRERRGKYKNNVYVYRFSQPTHIPGYKECWGKSCHTAELPYAFQAMDIIRSNYSTLSPLAEKDAPAAPEYPYSEMLAAYRGALESFDHYFDEEQNQTSATSRKDGSVMTMNHTRAFNRILRHFFGDYFKQDADEELASDMAERWAAFAKGSDPNYDGSKAEWIPWRYQPPENSEDELAEEEYDDVDNPWVMDGEYDYWSDVDEYDDDPDVAWTLDREERAYRKRALAALNMEVVEEDVFRTELRRRVAGTNDNDLDKTFLTSRFLFRSTLKWSNEKDTKMHPPISKRAVREIIRVAQEMGALGVGLEADDRWPDVESDNVDFFPELLELKWPPEGRVIERDCTCDLWDKIRYRY